jgi:hypothetical protein
LGLDRQLQKLGYAVLGAGWVEFQQDPALVAELPADGWPNQGLTNKGLLAVLELCGRCLQKPSTGGHCMKEMLYFDGGPKPTSGWALLPLATAVA